MLVVDVVESVRLMQRDEVGFIHRWRGFVAEVQNRFLSAPGARLVKSLGDGLLLEFVQVAAAVDVALALHALMAEYNQGFGPEAYIHLRVGIHAADVVVDVLDVYGAGVNLAARLAGLAGPGDVVVSTEVRDAVVDGLQADVTDLGDCYLKHVDGPVRAYRLSRPLSSQPAGSKRSSTHDLRPAVAVLPFETMPVEALHSALGDALCDDINAALSAASNLRIVSRLSTSCFRGRAVALDTVRDLLGVAYVVSGHCRVHGDRVALHAELCETRSGGVLWSGSSEALIADIFRAQDKAMANIVAQISCAIIQMEVSRVRNLPLPTLESYSLYVGGVALLHRLSVTDFQHSHELLEDLSQRQPRSAAPRAMLAKWHILRLLQGWTADVQAEGSRARDWARRALELEPDQSLALSMTALVSAHFGNDLDAALADSSAAVAADPQEPQAWLMLAGVQSYLGQGDAAEAAAQRALSLSPLDPGRYLFELLRAAGQLAAQRFDDAAASARESLRLNAMHAPSHRLLVIALELGGQHVQAKQAAAALLRVTPDFQIDHFERRYPGRNQPHAPTYVQALRNAGLPT